MVSACSPSPPPPTDNADAVQQRAIDAQTARRRTGAEIQERALTRTIKAIYICENTEQLTVEFDNPRRMATVRQRNGLAYDLAQQPAASGIWYKADAAELRGKGNEAVWTLRETEPTNCRAVD